MAQLFTSGKFQGFDSSGNPLAAGKLYSYAAGTLTLLPTYTTQAGDVANANPVVLDSAGRASVWLGASSYRMVLKDAAGTTISDTDNISSAGSSSITFTQSGTGAVGRTLQDKGRELVTVADFLPVGFDTATNATAYIQAALDSGAKVIDFLGTSLKCDAVTVPAGVSAKSVNFSKYTNAAGNMVLVNTGCTVTGKITGSGFTGGTQRGVYSAVAGVTDVALLLEVSGFTHSVHAGPVGAASTANNPKRWTGYVYVNGTVGVVGNSEGYGVLLESAQACSLTVKGKDVRRHLVYLSAGASWNTVECDVDGCGNYAAQINTLSPQSASQHNTLIVRARNLTTDVAGQSGALAIAGRSHFNVCQVFCEGNATTYEAVRIEGGSSGVQADHPLGNQIIKGAITGQFTGADVVRMLNADSTIVSGNTIHAYGTVSVIATRRTGTNLSLHGGYIEGNQINAQGQAIKGIYDEINTVPSYIGPNEISNNSSGARVDDQTSGYRTGYSRRLVFSGTTASITATTVGDTTVTFAGSQSIAIAGRRGQVFLTNGSVSFTNPHGVIRVTHPSATTLAFRAYNAAGVAQTFDYEGTVEGD